MAKKPRLSSLSAELSEQAQEDSQKRGATPERGQRGGFVKTTITIDPEMLTRVKVLGLKLRARGQKDTDFSSLVREALSDYLAKHEQSEENE